MSQATFVRRAIVVGIGQNVAWVVLDDETVPRLAALRRSSNQQNAAARIMPVPGDIADVRLLEDDSTVIERLESRRISLERRTAGGRSKTLAANVDTLVTVTALANPDPRLVVLDQLLAFAELETLGLISERATPIAPIVVFTKPDLAEVVREVVDAQPQYTGKQSIRSRLESLYRGLGYPVITLNPKRGENVEALREALAGKHALLCGNSGVGKSSIFRALGGEALIGDTSRHGLGKQTTTAARLYRMGDGFLIDSPGVNEFGLGKIEPNELAQAFIEIRELAPNCRFNDCTHLQEPGCAVRAAVEDGHIAESRYASYRKILLEPT